MQPDSEGLKWARKAASLPGAQVVLLVTAGRRQEELRDPKELNALDTGQNTQVLNDSTDWPEEKGKICSPANQPGE